MVATSKAKPGWTGGEIAGVVALGALAVLLLAFRLTGGSAAHDKTSTFNPNAPNQVSDLPVNNPGGVVEGDPYNPNPVPGFNPIQPPPANDPQ